MLGKGTGGKDSGSGPLSALSVPQVPCCQRQTLQLVHGPWRALHWGPGSPSRHPLIFVDLAPTVSLPGERFGVWVPVPYKPMPPGPCIRHPAQACAGPQRSLYWVAGVPAWPSRAWGSPTAGLSTSQFRKDMATQRKDPKGQPLSLLRLQNRDRLFQASTSHSLELQRQDLKFRWPHHFPPGPCDGTPPWSPWRLPHRLPAAELL